MSVDGLSDEESRRRLLPSKTTSLGIVQHTAAVERFLFQRTLQGLEPSDISGLSDATDLSWGLDPRATIASVLRDHDAVKSLVVNQLSLPGNGAHDTS